MIKGFRRLDPLSISQLAVPVRLAKTAYRTALLSKYLATKHTDFLIIVAFYYLLRVGEYAKPRTVLKDSKRVSATRTKQFVVQNVGFFKNSRVILCHSFLIKLLTADIAVLKITNQKNGQMGQVIAQYATGNEMCLVLSLAHIVHQILSNWVNKNTLLCSYFENGKWGSIESKNVVSMVKSTAKAMKLGKQGIDPDLIGAYSLRIGRAMALKFCGYVDTTIMKMGQWTLLTFLQYIHNQIVHLSSDISKK